MRKTSGNGKMNPFLKIVLIVCSIILLFAISAAGFLWFYLDKITYADELNDQETASSGETNPVAETQLEDDYSVNIDALETLAEIPTIPDKKIAESKNVINILLIGTDERTTQYSANARADSMILVSINKDLKTVRLVSLERGIGVPILEGELKGEYDLLTHVFRWGGADLLTKTVEHCFKIEVDHYVRLNFASVEKVIDAVGGINITLSEKEADGLNAWNGPNDAPFQTGENRLDGARALRFARLRYIDSDWQRVGRQRKVILAVVDELKTASLKELTDLADQVLPLIQTNMSKLEIADLILYAPNFLTSDFDQMTIPKQGTYGGMKIRNGGGAFAVDYEINNDLLYRFLYEGVSSETLLAE